MAQAAGKRPREAQQQLLRSVYDVDDKPSMALELFGYHHGVVVNGDDAVLPELAFDDSFKAGGGCGAAGDYYGWPAYSASAAGGSGSSSSSSSSVLSFEQAGSGGQHLAYGGAGDDECALWMDAAAAGMVDDHHHGAAKFGFMNPGSVVDVGLPVQETANVNPPAKAAQKQKQKRACPGGEVQRAGKRQCGGGKKSKARAAPSSSSPTIDIKEYPQGVAAKVRRERISERLKVLQDLVPNGTKVDLVTMLEKAINYVKFLQLQVKVLATDEFWPAQGGKAPELSQVKDALDAILSSQLPNK